ncbi:MAG TPA: O-antigen ligase family protein [Bryobacteraceae bacterium]|jgi:O-antigen ligase|nr:O-antigen ligase family protein [Bryobacteraceae bacterium]
MSNLLPLAAAVVALLILPGWSFSYDVIPKVVIVLLGAAAAPWIQPKRPTLLAWIIYAQIATTVVAALFSTHPQLSWLGGTWRRSGVIAEAAALLLGLAFVAVPRERILRITLIGALPVALYGILQYFGIDPLIDSKLYHVGEGAFQIVRPPSTLGHADYFATFLLFPIFAGAALALSETARAWKIAGFTISGVSTLALVLSGTRAALLGLIVGAIFVAIRGRRANWKWIAAAAGLLTILAAIYISPAGEKLRARVHWSTEDRFGGARPLLWLDSLRMSRQHLLVGFGPETFAREFPRHQSVALAAAYPDFYHESPHNIFLDALVSKGLLGLVPVIGMAVLGLVLARGAIGGAFVAMLVSQQFTSFTIPTELFWMLCISLLTVEGGLPGPSGTPSSRLMKVALALPFAAFAIYLAIGDALLASALRAVNRGDFNSAALLQERASKWGATADLNFSRRMLAKSQSLPDPADRVRGFLFAKQAALRAPTTSEDRQNALVNLAAFYAVENNVVMVERCLRDAIQAAPNWFKPHWLLAQVLARANRQNEAILEARRAVECDGGKNPEVTQTLRFVEGR